MWAFLASAASLALKLWEALGTWRTKKEGAAAQHDLDQARTIQAAKARTEAEDDAGALTDAQLRDSLRADRTPRKR